MENKNDPRVAFGNKRAPAEKQLPEKEAVEVARENLNKAFSREQFKQKGEQGEDARKSKPL